MTNHNRKIFSKALLHSAIGLFLIGFGFLLYRITTNVPNSTLTGIGVFFRSGLAIAFSSLCLIASRTLYLSIKPEPRSISEQPHYVPTPEYTQPYSENVEEIEAPTEITEDLGAPESQYTIDQATRDAFFAGHPILKRVNTIMKDSFSDTALLSMDDIEYSTDEEHSPISFNIISARAGSFADKNLVGKIFNAVTASIPEGKILWGMEQNIAKDTLTFKKKTPFKKMVFPDLPDKVVSNSEEALKLYKGLRFKVGEDAFGETITIDPTRAPHGLIIGGTGAGKSVFTRGLIEDLRSQGWQIVIVDGKKSDYVSMVNVPNVIMVSGKVEDWVRTIEFVNANVEARYERAAERKRKGQLPEFDQPPMLFLVDETGSVMRDLKNKYGKNGHKYVNNLLKNIAAKARQAKVHMVMAAQDAYAETFDGDLKANLSFRIALGKLENRTLTDAFSVDVRDEAQRIGQSITKKDAGRGIIEIQDDKLGITVVEFQSYFAYSPGNEDGIPNFEPAKSEWTKYKENVSDNIPRLYPRIWWSEPEPDDLKEIESPEVLENYPIFAIQDENGNILPGMEKYDRMDDDYIGFKTSGEGSDAFLVGFGMGQNSTPAVEMAGPAGDDSWTGEDSFSPPKADSLALPVSAVVSEPEKLGDGSVREGIQERTKEDKQDEYYVEETEDIEEERSEDKDEEVSDDIKSEEKELVPTPDPISESEVESPSHEVYHASTVPTPPKSSTDWNVVIENSTKEKGATLLFSDRDVKTFFAKHAPKNKEDVSQQEIASRVETTVKEVRKDKPTPPPIPSHTALPLLPKTNQNPPAPKKTIPTEKKPQPATDPRKLGIDEEDIGFSFGSF